MGNNHGVVEAPSDGWRSWLAAATLVAVVYVYFLLFAEFAFVELVRGVVSEAGAQRSVLACLGGGGICGSLLGAAVARRFGNGPALRGWLIGCFASAAVASGVTSGGITLLAFEAACIGISLGGATVSLAGVLESLAGTRRAGLAIGLGTGAAYAVCNIPALFLAGAVAQSEAAAIVALGGVAITFKAELSRREQPGGAPVEAVRLRWWLLAFTGLVWMDSAAFYVIQHTQSLRDHTWEGAGRLWLNAGVHLLAGVGAGVLLDRGWMRGVLFASAALLAGASLSISASWASLPYVTGASLYSAALVRVASDRHGGRWRGAVLFAVAGWTGSALGIGMAQDLDRIPLVFVVLAVVIIGFGVARARAMPALVTLAFALMCVPKIGWAESGDAARGREVYIAEGCINCHSQFIRPGTGDVLRWGPAHPLRELLVEQPPLFGNRRVGPDLLNVGNRRSAEWNRLHLEQPRLLSPGSRMPSYAGLFACDGQRGRDLVAYLETLGAGTGLERSEVVTKWTPGCPIPEAAGAQGLHLFRALCAQCHGENGRGDGALADRLRDAPADLGRPGISRDPIGLARTIRFGRFGTSMAGHESLSDHDVVALAAHVLSLEAGAGASARGPDRIETAAP